MFVGTQVFNHPSIKKAKTTLDQTALFCARAPKWIQRYSLSCDNHFAELCDALCDRPVLEKLVDLCAASEEHAVYGILFVVTYAFLLRMPSEALPITAGGVSPCSLCRQGSALALSLKRRKNLPGGTKLLRGCWCRQSPKTCPVHIAGPYLDRHGEGQGLFAGVTAASALKVLRQLLAVLKVEGAGEYRTHDFRRGHAKDLQQSGAPLWKILEAGQWRSPAFLKYLDMNSLDTELVAQAHCDESDEEPEDSWQL